MANNNQNDYTPAEIKERVEERRRLNARIHSITGTDIARHLAKFRKEIDREDSVAERNARYVYVEFEGRRFYEANDALTLLHEYLDLQGVDALVLEPA